MRRTRVMLEFSDEIYDTIVEPLKRNSSFSKLLASLVEGYVNDEYIRSYADNTIDDMRKAAVVSFNQSIDSMSESLSNMGLFTDELESTALSGKVKFEKKATQVKDELFDNDEEVSSTNKVNDTVNNEEIDKINKRINDMQDSFNNSMSRILDLLEKNSQGNLYAQGMPTMMNPMFNPMVGMYSQMPNMGNQGFINNQGYDGNQGTINNGNIPVSNEKLQENITSSSKSIDEEGNDKGTLEKEKSATIEKNEVQNNDTYGGDKGSSSESIDDFAVSEDDINDANNFMSFMLEGNSFEF